MRFLLLFLTAVLQLNASGYNAYNPQENHVQKTLTSENTNSNERSDILFRYYSPDEGMYLSQDPIGLAGGLNVYAYVNDVNSWVDEFGLTGKYVQTNVLGRKVYQNTADFNGGVPSHVDPIVAKTNPKVQVMLDSGASNYDLMNAGYAPIGKDGKQINLHHVLGQEPGPMVELLDSTHKEHYKPLHGLVEDGNSFRNNKKLKAQYEKFRKDYWKERAKSFEGGCH